MEQNRAKRKFRRDLLVENNTIYFFLLPPKTYEITSEDSIMLG